jgi:hypothetical protein
MSRCSVIRAISRRAAASWVWSSASGGGGKGLFPSIKPVGLETELSGNHRGRLATVEPILQRFALEGFTEFTADFDWCLVHGLDGSLFTQFSVRRFEAPSFVLPVAWRVVEPQNLPAFATSLTSANDFVSRLH